MERRLPLLVADADRETRAFGEGHARRDDPEAGIDNGPEMSSREFMDWAHKNNIAIEYIQPGKLIQNAFIESFSSRFRDECLNEELFHDLKDAQKKIEKWRTYHNEERSHSSIRMKTSNAFEEEFDV